MTTTLVVNGRTYTDDSDPTTGMGNGGHRARLLPMLSDTMVDISAKQAACLASELAAAASATTAVTAPGTSATSTTSLSVSIASKVLTIQTGKNIVVGMYLMIAKTSDANTWMHGVVTAYNSGTGSLTVNVTRVQGSGTLAAWTVSLAAPGSPETGGSQGSAVSISLSASALKSTLIQTNSFGRVVTMSGSSASLAGPAPFAVRNYESGYGVDVKVTDGGALSGYLAPGKTARIDAGNLTYKSSDLRPFGVDVQNQVAFSSIVAGTAGVWTKAVTLASGNTLVLVHGASLHAVVWDAVNNVFGTPVLVRSGLSTAGADGTVVAISTSVGISDTTDNVLVSSVPDSGTAVQTVVLQIATNGTTITPGTMVPSTLATAATRIVGFRYLGTPTVNHVFALAIMCSTTTLGIYGVVVPVSSGTVTVGTRRDDTTTSSFGAILAPDWSGNPGVYTSVFSTATVLSARAVTVNDTTGAQVVGTTATATVTTASNIYIRIPLGSLTNTGPYAIAYTNTLPKIAKLTVTGTVPVFSSAVSILSTITTVNTYAISPTYGTAVSGTDSSGRFITEMYDFDMSGSAPVAITAVTTVTMSAAHTVVWTGLTGNLGVTQSKWQLLSATELVVANTQTGGLVVPTVSRLAGVATFAQVLAAPDPNFPCISRAKTTLASLFSNSLAVTDGTKPSLVYSADTASAAPSAAPFSLANSLTFGSFPEDDNAASAWIAAGPSPSLSLLIQKVSAA